MNYNELIKAIAELWKVIVPILIFITICIFKDNIKQGFPLLKKFVLKKGDTEFSLEKTENQEKEITEELIESQNKLEDIEKKESLDKEESEYSIEEFISHYFLDEKDKAEKIYSKLQENTENKENKLINEALYYHAKFLRGDKKALDILENLLNQTDNNDTKARISNSLGSCYYYGNHYNKAKVFYKKASELTKDITSRCKYLIEFSKSSMKNGESDLALKIIIDEIDNQKGSNEKAILYKGLSNLYKEMNNKEKAAMALMKVIELVPNDTDSLFSLSYLLSELDMDYFAAYFYNIHLNFSPKNSSSMNNLGVAYSRLDLPINSITYFKKSFELGNTLAASNIADRLIKSGFETDASEILKNAEKMDDIHENVNKAIVDLDNRTKKENEKIEKINKSSNNLYKFFKEYSTQLFSKNSIQNYVFEGEWTIDNEINIDQIFYKDNLLTIIWKVKKGENKKFEGVIENYTIKFTTYTGTIMLFSDDPYYTKDGIGYAYFIDPSSIRILDYSDKSNPSLLTIAKK